MDYTNESYMRQSGPTYSLERMEQVSVKRRGNLLIKDTQVRARELYLLNDSNEPEEEYSSEVGYSSEDGYSSEEDREILDRLLELENNNDSKVENEIKKLQILRAAFNQARIIPVPIKKLRSKSEKYTGISNKETPSNQKEAKLRRKSDKYPDISNKKTPTPSNQEDAKLRRKSDKYPDISDKKTPTPSNQQEEKCKLTENFKASLKVRTRHHSSSQDKTENSKPKSEKIEKTCPKTDKSEKSTDKTKKTHPNMDKTEKSSPKKTASKSSQCNFCQCPAIKKYPTVSSPQNKNQDLKNIQSQKKTTSQHQIPKKSSSDSDYAAEEKMRFHHEYFKKLEKDHDKIYII